MKRVRSLELQEGKDALILISPLILLLIVFILYPVLSNFYYSLTEWKGFGTPKFVGFKNYLTMLGDEKFWYSLRNLAIMILYIPFGVFLPLFLAALLRDGIKGWSAFRVLMYLPTVLGPVLVGAIFSIALSQDGPIIETLTRIGFEEAIRVNILGQVETAIHAVAIIFIIIMKIGFGTIYFLAAMSSVDKYLYDAARIDGAGWWQVFFNVTVPGVSFALQFFTVLSFIEVFARMYSIIHMLTYGGPGFTTYTLEFGIYIQSFRSFKMGYASSWSVILFLFCSIIAFVQIRILRKGDNS